jgi:hypothetical protein
LGSEGEVQVVAVLASFEEGGAEVDRIHVKVEIVAEAVRLGGGIADKGF